MPRLTIDRLVGYRFDVRVAERQVHDQGMPVFNGSGQPKMETVWQFVWALTSADGTTHIVEPQPMNDEERKTVVQALTGGVQPATLIDLPPGVDLGKL